MFLMNCNHFCFNPIGFDDSASFLHVWSNWGFNLILINVTIAPTRIPAQNHTRIASHRPKISRDRMTLNHRKMTTTKSNKPGFTRRFFTTFTDPLE